MSNFGHARERQVKRLREAEGWLVVRAAGSLGTFDLVAMKDGYRPRLIEVKATAAGPFAGFLPADRAEISEAARLAGADAELAWYPKRGKLSWITEDAWPERKVAA